MTWAAFHEFFRTATDRKPFPYQKRLAVTPAFPAIMDVPTGAGKTAAVVLAWIWRRRFHPDPEVRASTPRRLIYCLPMRVLVEQTHGVIQSWLNNLSLLRSASKDESAPPGQVELHLALGGQIDDDWLLYPEREAIIVGTMDLLVSRALNRGYALSRFRWPIAFGLLNNDCLWVLDEVQLMGAGLATTAQLAAFRDKLSAAAPCPSLWMSATVQPGWLKTVDYTPPPEAEVFRLADRDRTCPALARRLQATKTLNRLDLPARARDRTYARELAQAVLARHQPESLTLVVVNTVARARAIYNALQQQLRGSGPELLLLHSQFRPPDRAQQTQLLSASLSPQGRIAVTTQTIEAGVDLSARLLVTELAPWASMVQRFGRCNRTGDEPQAQVLWVDLDDRSYAPYSAHDLQLARATLQGLENQSVGPDLLPQVALSPPDREVLRRRDLIDLFDTAPDLSGNDVDVSRFIRATSDLDVLVCWEQWPEQEGPPASLGRPPASSLCSVPVNQMREFLQQPDHAAWAWDHLESKWRRLRPDQLRPGQVVLMHRETGGYAPETGWNPDDKRPVPPVPTGKWEPEEGTGDDLRSFKQRSWQTLTDHTNAVAQELQGILTRLPELHPWSESLRQAARWHDAGKGHFIFQATLLAPLNPAEADQRKDTIWAKSALSPRPHGRPHFRHELASALAFLQHHPNGPDTGLTAYLVAAHHGRVRLAIRAAPGERQPTDRNYPPDARFALGNCDGDPLPSADLGSGESLPPTELVLAPMELGSARQGVPSWLEMSLGLRDRLGPFRLAYLEAVLRAADVRASARLGEEATPGE